VSDGKTAWLPEAAKQSLKKDDPAPLSAKEAEIADLIKYLPLENPKPWWNDSTGHLTSTYTACRHEPVHVIKGKHGNVYGGSRIEVTDLFDEFDLVVNCTGSSDVRRHTIPLEALAKFEKVGKVPIEIILNWPDMGVVDINPLFWRELWKEIETKGYKTLVYCVGGHGRTGTALASLLVAAGYTGAESIKLVRKIHCSSAIETLDQEGYVKKLYHVLWGKIKTDEKEQDKAN